MASEPHECALCHAPVRGGGEFCCAGCARVWDVLQRLDERAGSEYLAAARRLGIVPDDGAERPAAGTPALPPDPEARRDERFEVGGLTCPSCSWVLEQVLASSPGVEAAAVDLFTETASVRLDLRRTSADRLIALAAPLGYALRPVADEGRGAAGRGLTLSFVVCAVLFVNMMSLSTLRYAEGLGWLADVPAYLSWVELAMLVPVLGLGWLPMLRRAAAGLRAGRPTMDLLIGVAVGAATVLSLAALLTGRRDLYFETAAGLTTIALLSRMIEARLRDRAFVDLVRLMRLRVRRVRLLTATGQEDFAGVEGIDPGDVVRFLPGEQVPFDGVVGGGAARVSEAVLTGEPRPLPKVRGDRIVAGSLVIEGTLDLAVTRGFAETRLHEVTERVGAALAEAQGALRSADRLAARFVPAVLALALAVWVVRWLVHGAAYALGPEGWFPSVAVLAVACPCAFSLAGVAALTAAIGALLRRGVLVGSAVQLERLRSVRRIVFDKTGTLSEGAMTVDRVVWRGGERPELLARVLASEDGCFHPVAGALRAWLARRELPQGPAPGTARDVPGRGRVVPFGDGELLLGARSLFADPFDPPGLRPSETAVWFGEAGRAEGCFLLADRLRGEAAGVLARLREAGYALELLSGDRSEVTAWTAAELGIAEARGGASLDDKVARVRELEAAGERVLFVGDGTNDALAMAEATAGLALARSTDEALAAAGFVALDGTLDALPDLLRTGERLGRVIRANYAWAFGFNAVFVPVAAAGALVPLAAMLLMLASSTAVLLSSLRLR